MYLFKAISVSIVILHFSFYFLLSSFRTVSFALFRPIEYYNALSVQIIVGKSPRCSLWRNREPIVNISFLLPPSFLSTQVLVGSHSPSLTPVFFFDTTPILFVEPISSACHSFVLCLRRRKSRACAFLQTMYGFRLSAQLASFHLLR